MSDENEIALDLTIKSADSAKTVKELKTAIKDLKNELQNVEAGSEQFNKLSKAINDTEGKLGDLNDQFNTLTGSGVERTTSSLGLLREGFANFDFDKIKLGFKGLGAAMSAVPIFFMVQGLQYLWENFDKIVEIFTPVNFGLNKMTKEFEALQKVTSLLGDELKREIEILEAQGASSEKILAKKKELVKIQINEAQASINLRMEKIKEVLMNDSVTESIDKTVAALYRKVGAEEAADALEKAMYANKYQRVQEDFKSIEASQKNILDLKNSLLVEEAKIQKKSSDDYKKAEDEKLKKTQENFEAYKKAYKEMDDYRRKIEDDFQAKLHQQALDDRKRLETKHEDVVYFGEQDLNTTFDNINKTTEKKIWSTEKEKEAINQSFEVAKLSNANQTKLVNLFYDHKRSKLEKGSAEELKAAKRQFQINKALAIQSAIISGIQGVVNALSAQSVIPEPFGTILKVATAVGVGVAAAVNVAKIASTKFDESGGGGSTSADVGTLSSGATAPAIPTPNNTVTKISNDGKVENANTKPQDQKVYVLETDIKKSNDRVANIEETAKIG